MAERLREVAEETLCGRVVFLSEQADSLRITRSCSNISRASSPRPIMARAFTGQKEHKRNAPSPGGSPSSEASVRSRAAPRHGSRREGSPLVDRSLQGPVLLR